MRLLKTKKELSIEYLKKSKEKWKAANFTYALSHAQTNVFRLNSCLKQIMQSIDANCRLIAKLSGSVSIFDFRILSVYACQEMNKV